MTRDTLTKIIDKSQEYHDMESRNYIGASSIGSDCWRQIWYQYKGFNASDIPPKTRRIWDVGKNLEGLVIDWMEQANIKICNTGKNYSSRNLDAFQGHVDCLFDLNDETFILEIKTAKDASFKIFKNKGIRLWNVQYYCQIQAYMGMSGIDSAYILVLNKDNSELSDELIHFDAEFYNKLEQKAIMIESAVSEPPRISNSPLWHQCKTCKFNKECHK